MDSASDNASSVVNRSSLGVIRAGMGLVVATPIIGATNIAVIVLRRGVSMLAIRAVTVADFACIGYVTNAHNNNNTN